MRASQYTETCRENERREEVVRTANENCQEMKENFSTCDGDAIAAAAAKDIVYAS